MFQVLTGVARSLRLFPVLLLAATALPPRTATADDKTIFYAAAAGEEGVATRNFSGKGKTISVWVDSCDVGNVVFSEEKRDTVFVEDLKKILKQAQGTAKAACPTGRAQYDHVLQYNRSSLTITALKPDGSELSKLAVSTGPVERLFVSLDLPVSNRKTLKYDSTSQTLQPSADSPQLYWSLNVQAADVVDPSRLRRMERFNLKFMFQASSKPLDSLGVAIGCVLPAFDGLDLSALSLFAGSFWTKEDTLDGAVLKKKDVYAQQWRAGVSYNLDDALKWIKF